MRLSYWTHLREVVMRLIMAANAIVQNLSQLQSTACSKWVTRNAHAYNSCSVGNNDSNNNFIWTHQLDKQWTTSNMWSKYPHWVTLTSLTRWWEQQLKSYFERSCSALDCKVETCICSAVNSVRLAAALILSLTLDTSTPSQSNSHALHMSHSTCHSCRKTARWTTDTASRKFPEVYAV